MYFLYGKKADAVKSDTSKPRITQEGNMAKDKSNIPFGKYLDEDSRNNLVAGLDPNKVMGELKTAQDEWLKSTTASIEKMKGELLGIFTEVSGETSTTPPPQTYPPIPPEVPPRVPKVPWPSMPSMPPLPGWPAYPAPEKPIPAPAPVSYPPTPKPEGEINIPIMMPEEPAPAPEPTPIAVGEPNPSTPAIEQLDILIKSVEKMNADVLARVDSLEKDVKARSEEINTATRTTYDEVLDRAERLRKIMYDGQIKDLELQQKSFEMLDACEDKALERAKKMKDLYD